MLADPRPLRKHRHRSHVQPPFYRITLYHFGVLTSGVHVAWMRVVAGRSETRYRYSKDLVYNKLPVAGQLPLYPPCPPFPTQGGGKGGSLVLRAIAFPLPL